METKTKICSKCKEEKLLSKFNTMKKNKDGLNIYCRDCQFIYNKEYREKNKDKLNAHRSTPEYKEIRRKYRAKHKKEIAEYNKEYYNKNKKILAEKYKPYRTLYWETHNEEQNKLARIRFREKKRPFVKNDEKEFIENYKLALADDFRGWQRHHRLETHNSDGEKRLVEITPAELKALGMYYDRPANELIWLTDSEHFTIHSHRRTKCQK